MDEFKKLLSMINVKDVKTTKVNDDCKHSRKEEDNGTVFCIDCGEVFEDETVFQRNHFITYDDESHKPSEMKKEKGNTTKPAKAEVPKTASDLKKLAKERGIKYYSRMSKKELCEVLETSLAAKPSKIVFTNKETGEEHGFKSLYQASREMKVNPGLISYYEEKDKEMKIGETTYTIKRL